MYFSRKDYWDEPLAQVREYNILESNEREDVHSSDTFLSLYRSVNSLSFYFGKRENKEVFKIDSIFVWEI